MNGGRTSRVLLVLLFPAVLAVGIVLIPVVTNYADHVLASEAVEHTARWFLGHLLSAVAFGLSLVSFSEVVAHLRSESHEAPSFILPCMAVAAGCYAAGLGADGIGFIAVRVGAASPVLFLEEGGLWVGGVFVIATLVLGVGLIALVIAAIHGRMLRGVWRYVAFTSAVLFVSIPAVPSGWGLYGEAVAAATIFGPLAIVTGCPVQQPVIALTAVLLPLDCAPSCSPAASPPG